MVVQLKNPTYLHEALNLRQQEQNVRSRLGEKYCFPVTKKTLEFRSVRRVKWQSVKKAGSFSY